MDDSYRDTSQVPAVEVSCCCGIAFVLVGASDEVCRIMSNDGADDTLVE